MPKATPVADRFWVKVNTRGPIPERRPDLGRCWIWTAATNGRYGIITGHYAHRLSYEMAHGSIRDGLVIDHLCATPLCVNPDHLEPVTQQTNVLRGVGFAAIHSQKTACPQGHVYDEANVYLYRGCRYCRACMRERNRKRAQSLKSRKVAV